MAQQFYVDLGIEPTIKHKNYVLWNLSYEELESILRKEDWGSRLGRESRITWELRKETARKVKDGTFHPTARARKTAPAPIRDFLAKDGAQPKKVLYYGCGKDEPGLEAIGRGGAEVRGYDPYHEDEEFRVLPEASPWPEEKFDEVFCVYTLNVVDKETGLEILTDFWKQLKSKGSRAIIAVRRDL